MSSLEFKDEFFKRLKKVNKAPFLRQMTGEAGVIAVNFSKERFIYKNWLDKSPEKWEERHRKAKGTLMKKSGRLKRSIRKIYSGNYYVMIGTDVPYAQIHNEGGTIRETVSVKAHTRTRKSRKGRTEYKVKSYKRKMNTKIPPRQFVGESLFLSKKIQRHLIRSLDHKLSKK